MRQIPARLIVLLLVATPLDAEVVVRVATYNIKYLSTDVTNEDDRLDKLRQVIEKLDADVIGLQEIDNRKALELIFDPAKWILVIDDDSNKTQDLALVVRRPFGVSSLAADFDADDEHFLFSGVDNSWFPDRRDVLSVEITAPNEDETFFVMVHHAKSRSGGRATNDHRRVEASRHIIQTLESGFDETLFILLGDFNDNPDDESLNILETGDPDALAGPEQIAGPFLINLTEPLLIKGHVSNGLNTANIQNNVLNTLDPDSRARNNTARGTDQHTGRILFDQLLIPAWMIERWVEDSTAVFNDPVAASGNTTNRASDHVPVFADFLIGVDDQPVPLPLVRITSLLPNPIGEDRGNEQVTISNFTGATVTLTDWFLRDRADNEFELSGTVPANDSVTITMPNFAMPLNNSGDDISLFDDQANRICDVSYGASDAVSGNVVTFP